MAIGSATAASASLAFVPAAQAQDAKASGDSAALEEVVVTGSRIRRVDIETASPVFVIDQAAIQQSGVTTVGELVSRLPSVAGAATNPAVNNGGGFGEQNIELRGLDAKRTLILLDGRRVGIVGASDATDVNQIPLNSIERVEVLKEGAGAVYGSDAIAGVVNFITRKNVDGLEVNGDYGRTSKNDGEHYSIDALFGTSTDKLNFQFGGSYTKQKAVSAGAREFSKFALYLYGGSSGIVKGGSSRTPTGRIFMPATNPYGCGSVTRIAGAAGSALGDYRCWAGAPDRFNYQPDNLLITPQERGAVFTKVNYQINDYVDVYGSVLYNRTYSGYQIAPLPFDATVDDVVISKDSVYNPFGIDFGGISAVNPDFMLRMRALGDRRSEAVSDSKIINAGVKGKLADTGWEWDVNLSYSRLDQLQTVFGYLLKSKLTNAFGPSFIDPATGIATCGTALAPISGCTPVNIFNLTAPGQADALSTIAASYNTNNTSRYKAAALDLNGKVFDLPAGAEQASVGLDYSALDGTYVADTIAIAQPPLYLQCEISNEACTGNTDGKYNVKQAYVEFLIPILKDVPGAKALNLDIGTRYSDYSIFGNATKSQFKIEYRPVSDLLIRGTYSQVFRVPTINDIAAAPANTSVTFNDPCQGLTSAMVAANPNLALACVNVPRDGSYQQPNGQITGLNESNPNLKPETGKVYTAGIVYDPSWLPNFSMDVDYWKYKIEDLITLLDSNYSINQCVKTGNPTFCNLVTRYGAGTATPGAVLVFQNPTYNLGELSTDGIDLGLKYALKNTRIGSFQFSLDLTRINKYDNLPAPGAAVQHIVGTYDRQFGNYAKWRGMGVVSWSLGGFDGMLQLRYIDKIVLHNPSVAGTEPDLQIPSMTYVDATLGYLFPTKTKLQIGVRNLTDKQPPILYQNNVTNANTDVQTYDTIGRRWWVGFNQKF
ncbi:MAG: TonB-dependent receptor [Steroidobacteraceae bacterium]